MKIDYFKESRKYDCAASEIHRVIDGLKKKRVKDEEEARMNGWDEPEWYDLLIDVLKDVRASFIKKSNTYWNLHKQETHDVDEGAMRNLFVAVSKLWAEDYETALSRPQLDDSELRKLRNEAQNIVTDRVVNRVEKAHNEFVKSAHRNIFQIVEDTANAYKFKTPRGTLNHDGDHMKTRCPLCNGGMYAKRLAENKYLVKCPSCYLSEVVVIGS